MKIKSCYLFLAFILQAAFAKAQTEYLVTVDPVTGNYTVINSLPGVNYIAQNVTAIDKINHRYFFEGIDFGSTHRLYTINTVTGAIISQPVFTLNVSEFHYDNVLNKLFGLYPVAGGVAVASIDPASGTPTNVDTLTIPGISAGSSAYDEVNHRFMIQFGSTLYFSNTVSGATTSVTTAVSFKGMQYDNASGIMYAMAGSPLQFGTVNLGTGAFTMLSTLSGSTYMSNMVSLNELNHEYTFSDNAQFFTVSASGAVLYSPPFPALPAGQNIIEIHYDNANGLLYGLHWGNEIAENIDEQRLSDNYTFYPNPFKSAAATLSFSNDAHEAYTLSVYNNAGQQVISIPEITSNNVRIDRGKMEKGIYFFRLSTVNSPAINGKFIVD